MSLDREYIQIKELISAKRKKIEFLEEMAKGEKRRAVISGISALFFSGLFAGLVKSFFYLTKSYPFILVPELIAAGIALGSICLSVLSYLTYASEKKEIKETKAEIKKLQSKMKEIERLIAKERERKTTKETKVEKPRVGDYIGLTVGDLHIYRDVRKKFEMERIKKAYEKAKKMKR